MPPPLFGLIEPIPRAVSYRWIAPVAIVSPPRAETHRSGTAVLAVGTGSTPLNAIGSPARPVKRVARPRYGITVNLLECGLVLFECGIRGGRRGFRRADTPGAKRPPSCF